MKLSHSNGGVRWFRPGVVKELRRFVGDIVEPVSIAASLSLALRLEPNPFPSYPFTCSPFSFLLFPSPCPCGVTPCFHMAILLRACRPSRTCWRARRATLTSSADPFIIFNAGEASLAPHLGFMSPRNPTPVIHRMPFWLPVVSALQQDAIFGLDAACTCRMSPAPCSSCECACEDIHGYVAHP